MKENNNGTKILIYASSWAPGLSGDVNFSSYAFNVPISVDKNTVINSLVQHLKYSEKPDLDKLFVYSVEIDLEDALGSLMCGGSACCQVIERFSLKDILDVNHLKEVAYKAYLEYELLEVENNLKYETGRVAESQSRKSQLEVKLAKLKSELVE